MALPGATLGGDGRVAGECVERGLARPVGGEVRGIQMDADGRDEDDATRTRATHRPERRLHDGDRAERVDVEHLAHQLHVEIFERGDHGVARVADHGVKRATGDRLGLLHGRPDALGIRDVQMHHRHVRVVDATGVDVADAGHHLPASGAERGGHVAADATSRSGYERGLSFHVCIPTSFGAPARSGKRTMNTLPTPMAERTSTDPPLSLIHI